MRLRVPVVVASLLALVLGPAAGAVGTFSPPHQVGLRDGIQFVSAKAPDGSTHGYLACRSGPYYVQGSGSSWRTSRASLLPFAVAVGGTSTFAVWSDQTGIFVDKRSPSGRTTTTQVTKSQASRDLGVAIVASGSTWWVVWTEGNDQGGFNLWEARTLGGTVKAHRIFGSDNGYEDAGPSLAYQPSTGTAVLVWSSGASQGQLSTVMATNHGGAWGRPKVVDPGGQAPIVAVDGGTVVVVNTHPQNRCLCYVGVFTGTTSGHFTRHVLEKMHVHPTAMDVSRGKVTVAYTARDRTTGYKGLIRVAEGNGSGWTEKALSADPLDQLLDVQSSAGSARLFYKNRSGVKVRSQQAPVVTRTASPSPTPSPATKPVKTATPSPSVTAAATTAAPTSSPTATPTDLQGDKAAEDGPNLLVRGVEGLVLLVLLGGIVALLRRRRA